MRTFWSAEEEAQLRALFPDTDTKKLVSVFVGRTLGAINHKANKMQIQRSKAFLAASMLRNQQRGRAAAAHPNAEKTRFKAGLVPWNKGMSYRPSGSEKTHFQKGSVPKNIKQLGTIRADKGYLLQKTEKGWIPIHRLVWEQHHGPVPKGHVVAFKNRVALMQPEQITIDKLELVSRKNLLNENSGQQIPELWKLYQLKGAINRQRNRIIKEHQDAS